MKDVLFFDELQDDGLESGVLLGFGLFLHLIFIISNSVDQFIAYFIDVIMYTNATFKNNSILHTYIKIYI